MVSYTLIVHVLRISSSERFSSGRTGIGFGLAGIWVYIWLKGVGVKEGSRFPLPIQYWVTVLTLQLKKTILSMNICSQWVAVAIAYVKIVRMIIDFYHVQ